MPMHPSLAIGCSVCGAEAFCPCFGANRKSPVRYVHSRRKEVWRKQHIRIGQHGAQDIPARAAERRELIHQMVLKHKTMAKVARILGIHPTRVQQLEKRWRKEVQRKTAAGESGTNERR